MKKLLKDHWWFQWLVWTVIFFLVRLGLDCFDPEFSFTPKFILLKISSALVTGFIFTILFSSVNPFKKKQKKAPDSEKAG